MLATPIVVGEEQGQGSLVIVPTLAERAGQASHPLGEVANAAVHPFNVARADLFAGRVTGNGGPLHAYYTGGRILALLLFAGAAEYLHHLTVVNPLAEVPGDRVFVGGEAIGGELEPARRGDVELAAEDVGIFHRASAVMEGDQ